MVTLSLVLFFSLNVFIISSVRTTSDVNNDWASMSKLLSETFDSLDMPSIPSHTECIDMLEADNKTELTNILKACSKALTQLNLVFQDVYNKPTEKKTIIGRIGINFLSKLIIDDIAFVTENLTFTDDDFGYVRDEFVVSDRSEQVNYFIQAIEPFHSIEYQTDSYNATILTIWGVHDSKTKQLLNKYMLEKRRTKLETIYLFGLLNDQTSFVPVHIYGANLPVDAYFSTKLILIYLLNGKGKLGRYSISETETDYIMIVMNDNEMTDRKDEL